MSIHYAPFGKWIIVILALSPMSIFLAASNSSDPMIFSSAFLLVSIVLYLIYDTTFKITIIQTLLILLTVVTLATAKLGVYFIIAFLIFLIPQEKFFTKRYSYIFKIGILIFGLIVALLWNTQVKFLVDDATEGLMHINIIYLIQHPVEYIIVLGRTFYELSNVLFLSFFTLGWLDTPLQSYLAYLWGFIIVVLTIYKENPIKISKFSRIMLLVSGLSTVLMIMTSMYLLNMTGTKIIGGIQGRYFLPAALLILFGCSNFFDITRYKSLTVLQNLAVRTYLLQIFLFVFLAVTVYTVYTRYYVV